MFRKYLPLAQIHELREFLTGRLSTRTVPLPSRLRHPLGWLTANLDMLLLQGEPIIKFPTMRSGRGNRKGWRRKKRKVGDIMAIGGVAVEEVGERASVGVTEVTAGVVEVVVIEGVTGVGGSELKENLTIRGRTDIVEGT